ncbi:MAG: S8 family serine peptidase, partial [Dokdonella sp.]
MKPLALSIAIAVALAASAAADRVEAQSVAATNNASTPHPVELLANQLGIAASTLTDVQESNEYLLDGRQLQHVKALDAATGEAVGGSFYRGSVVDADQLRQDSERLWRFAHGAMTPALLNSLDDSPAGEAMLVDVWFAFAPPDHIASGGSQDVQGTTGVSVETDSRALTETEIMRLPSAPLGVENASPTDAQKQDIEVRDPVETAARKAEATARLQSVEAQNQLHIAEMQAAMQAPRQSMLDRLTAAGVIVIYASDMVPSIIVKLSRAQLEIVARWNEVAIVDRALMTGGAELDVARPVHNVSPVNNAGYNGTGVTVAVVEGGRVYSLNPWLTVSQSRDTSIATVDHTTAVGGIIASNHSTHRGMANGSTLISADGSYGVAGALETAADWAAARAQVLSNSWGYGDDATTAFNAFDRRLDYIGRVNNRLVVKSSGNAGVPNCGQSPSTAGLPVSSPGRGYNTLTVGGFNDGGTLDWDNDTLYNCSSFINPVGDSAGSAHQKPEVVASAVGITSLARTTSSTSPLSGAGTGTSFAAPSVSGLAADLMEANSQLASSPVATRTIVIAGAKRNIVGGAPISDQDGAGAINGTASTFTTEVGPWWYAGVDGTSFPRSYTVYARAGQRVRFVINWLSNITLSSGNYSNDRLPADLDLRAYRSNGTSVASSTSTPNAFEVVDFIAPVDDNYEMRVTLFGSWTGGAVPFAAAANLDGYLLPRGTWWSLNTPASQGMFFDIRPASEYSGITNYWRGVGLRSTTADNDLELYDTSWFDEPATTSNSNNRLLLSNSAA